MPSVDTSFIEDLPKGALDVYRKRANFDWKKLRLIFEEPDLLKMKVKVWNALEKDPLFQRPDTELLTKHQKRLAALQLEKFRKYQFMPTSTQKASIKDRARYLMTINEALAAAYPDVSVKQALGIFLFQNTLSTLGTERHQHLIAAVWNRQILSAFALTEVAHGSDAKNMRTTATYNKETQEFVINTPDFKAAKCWVGNLGKTCTIALVFAQLYTDGQCYGLHAFVVPIRDPKTLLPYPGIIVGDIGEKIGLNGIDNGFMMFQNYRIPRENLLNRTADVTPNGEYESSFSEPGRILGAALENLSAGRIGIMQESTNNLVNAVTIAIRYAALRTQFGPVNHQEVPIIEYQLHQWRLFPYVAAAGVLKVFVTSLARDYLNAVEMSHTNTAIQNLREMVTELHAIISATKPLITWTCRDAIQEGREACGGHGYLKAARFGDLRNTIDPTVTYEGDNNVLVQQTSNWLLRQWQNCIDTGLVHSPVGTCSFLENHSSILNSTFHGTCTNDVQTIDFVLASYKWLITYLVKITHEKQASLLSENECRFSARNNCQVYKASVLSKVYGEFVVLQYFCKRIGENDVGPELRPVLEKIAILYGLSCLDKHLVYFYQGKCANDHTFSDLVKNGILNLCADFKNDCVAVIDAMAPPDFVLNSILGKSDGKIWQTPLRKNHIRAQDERLQSIDYYFIPDLPVGPLDVYRKQATFYWKKLKLILEDSERLKIKYNVWKTLENDKIFERFDYDLPVDEQKRRATLQHNQFRKYNFELPGVQYNTLQKKLKHIMSVGQALVVSFPDVTVKHVVEMFLFQMSLMTLGTERHKHIIDACWNGQFASAFALTEVAHGSDAKNMMTTATYNESTQEFIINTPNFKAAKCWSGNLGKICTVAVVFAQLITKGTCYGLHAFVVQIRDPKTLLPYKGVTIGDGGEKIGLNGVDNGFLLFNNFRIPRENLLNKVADVAPNGEYTNNFPGTGSILSLTIGNLSTGRVAVIQESSEYLITAVIIAIRYAAVRTQFGPSNKKEISLIEYQLHQWRLFPYLVAAVVLKIFATKITDDYIELFVESLSEVKGENFQDIKSEMHAIICATKPWTTWTTRDAIQECREACGGHGYLKAARIGDLRNANDPRVTYEGDNNILLQQTSRWLLKQWDSVLQGAPVNSPLHSCSFLNNYPDVLQRKCTAQNVEDVKSYSFLFTSYEWLITYMVQETHTKLTQQFKEIGCLFTALNTTQVYKAAVLSRVYVEYVILTWYWKITQDKDVDLTLKPVLETIGLLYGLSCLDKHLPYFYEGNYCAKSSLTRIVKDGIIDLCATLKPNAVAIVDALAPPDFAVNSVLGKADGKLYENLENVFFKTGSLTRPEWWKEVKLDDCPDLKVTSKL